MNKLGVRCFADITPAPYLSTRNRYSRQGITLLGGGYSYFISRKRISSKKDLLQWIAHLSEKKWFTRIDLRNLIRYASKYGGVAIWS